MCKLFKCLLVLLFLLGVVVLVYVVNDVQLIKCGEYLVIVGDCVVCYSEKGCVLFSGGYLIGSFFGIIYSINIMFFKIYGIGQYMLE